MNPTKKPTFEVDKKGLAKLLERRGKEFAVLELWQNAVDEDGVTQIDMELRKAENDPATGQSQYELIVEDDAPEGFADLTHAYTLFAESKKAGRSDQRGRFNLGEKLVIAISEWVQISTTKGTIHLDESGREEFADAKREHGSRFSGILHMSDEEAKRAEEAVHQLIVPGSVTTTLNGVALTPREPVHTFEVTLRTELADDEGYLRPTRRKTKVAVYEPGEGETASVYELGIPVVETGDRWHVDVGQKVPLTTDRDNVPPGWLRDLRVAVLNNCADKLDDAEAKWVDDALEDDDVSAEAVQTVVKERFGDKAVIEDRTDPEGTKLAITKGYTVVPGGAFSKAAWKHVKRDDSLLPAGKVTPSPNPHEGEENLSLMEPEHWPEGVRTFVAYAKRVADVLLDVEPTVRVANEITWPYVATYGPTQLTVNYGRLGHAWFKPENRERWDALLLHEYAHHRVSDHLAHEFHDECTRLGAKLVTVALQDPEALDLQIVSEQTVS